MFNLLVESTAKTRRRTPKYFLFTFLVYSTIMLGAVIGSILIYRPALADTYESIAMLIPATPPPAGGGGSPQHAASKQPRHVVSETAVPTNTLASLDHVNLPAINTNDNQPPGIPGLPIGPGTKDGVIGISDPNFIPPVVTGPPNVGPAPEPPPAPKPEKRDNDIHKVSDGVILGHNITAPVPEYPRIAITARIEGAVRVELVIDKTGHVISATAVSGPPLLRAPAEAAARRALFHPTLLSGEPVIVQGLFTYNFKLH